MGMLVVGRVEDRGAPATYLALTSLLVMLLQGLSVGAEDLS